MGIKANKLVQVARQKVADGDFYYFQYSDGAGTGPKGFDCGSFVSWCVLKAGLIPGKDETWLTQRKFSAWYDGYFEHSDHSFLLNNGWEITTDKKYQVGDIICDGHVAIISKVDSNGNAAYIIDMNDQQTPNVQEHTFYNSSWTKFRLKSDVGVLNQFEIRTKSPVGENLPYYNKYFGPGEGGYNSAIIGNPEDKGGQIGADVLRNCVGYAQGRAMEIYSKYVSPINSYEKNIFKCLNVNACDFLRVAKENGLPTGSTPKVGAIAVYQSDTYWPGHVAVFEGQDEEGWIVTESHWSIVSVWDTVHANSKYLLPFMDNTDYQLLGFIYIPNFDYDLYSSTYDSYVNGTNIALEFGATKTIPIERHNYDLAVTYEEQQEEITRDKLKTATNTGVSQGTPLLTFPSFVETPYVMLQVGEDNDPKTVTFGAYSRQETLGSSYTVEYPNFIRGMNVVKVDGKVNQYSIQLVYQLEAGSNPNLLDQIFGNIGYGNVYISYGDWSSPNFVFKKERALITNLTVDYKFDTSQISYTLTCVSNSVGLASAQYYWPKSITPEKPSEKIIEILCDDAHNLSSIFTGMADSTGVITRTSAEKFIAADDKAIILEPKLNIDPISYINYLVSCMCSVNDTSESGLKNYVYKLVLHDDVFENSNGPYFEVKKVAINDSKHIVENYDTYSVDVGYPTNNLVTKFNVKTNNSWALLYEYGKKTAGINYRYSVGDDGKIYTINAPNLTTSAKTGTIQENQRTWWTNMVQFPIQAELTVKGLIRPAMLTQYIRINSYFYGHKHLTSGLYIVTQQKDEISASGYRTTLSLTRIGGDDDYIERTTEIVTTKKPQLALVENYDRERITIGVTGGPATSTISMGTTTSISSSSASAGGTATNITIYDADPNGGGTISATERTELYRLAGNKYKISSRNVDKMLALMRHERYELDGTLNYLLACSLIQMCLDNPDVELYSAFGGGDSSYTADRLDNLNLIHLGYTGLKQALTNFYPGIANIHGIVVENGYYTDGSWGSTVQRLQDAVYVSDYFGKNRNSSGDRYFAAWTSSAPWVNSNEVTKFPDKWQTYEDWKKSR